MQPNKYTDIHANSGQTDTQTGITKSYRYRQTESKQSVLSRKVIATQARKKKTRKPYVHVLFVGKRD